MPYYVLRITLTHTRTHTHQAAAAAAEARVDELERAALTAEAAHAARAAEVEAALQSKLATEQARAAGLEAERAALREQVEAATTKVQMSQDLCVVEGEKRKIAEESAELLEVRPMYLFIINVLFINNNDLRSSGCILSHYHRDLDSITRAMTTL